MGFEPIRKNEGKAIAARELPVGDVLEGHVTRFITTKSEYGSTVSPVLKDSKTGEETVVWAAGNLRNLRDDLKEAGFKLGVLVKITSVEPKKGSRYKSYFKIEVDEDNVLDESSIANEI